MLGKVTCIRVWPVIIADSARRHGVADDDMLHALRNPLRVFDFDDDFTMTVGADRSGNLLEVGVVAGGTLVVHAMPARAKFLREG